mmetsp:Transcript_104948/g.296911  ORF Transcript_104948/g.296911 Transcript_104948/m.296911 type:complete len:231 (-) Transcript_104948:76-768(-)
MLPRLRVGSDEHRLPQTRGCASTSEHRHACGGGCGRGGGGGGSRALVPKVEARVRYAGRGHHAHHLPASGRVLAGPHDRPLALRVTHALRLAPLQRHRGGEPVRAHHTAPTVAAEAVQPDMSHPGYSVAGRGRCRGRALRAEDARDDADLLLIHRRLAAQHLEEANVPTARDWDLPPGPHPTSVLPLAPDAAHLRADDVVYVIQGLLGPVFGVVVDAAALHALLHLHRHA